MTGGTEKSDGGQTNDHRSYIKMVEFKSYMRKIYSWINTDV